MERKSGHEEDRQRERVGMRRTDRERVSGHEEDRQRDREWA